MSEHFIVCGLGHVGYRIAGLLQRLGERVTVITPETRQDWRRGADDGVTRIILGDARDESLLRQAGLGEARAVIAATDQDLVNIEVLLDAQRLRPGIPVVLRVFDKALAERLESKLGARRALGVSAIAAPIFAAAAMDAELVSEFTVGDGDDRQTWVVGRLAGEAPPESARRGVHLLHDGERPTVLCTETEWCRLRSEPTPSERRKAARRAALWETLNPMGWARGVGRLWSGTSLALRVALATVAALTLVSVLIFQRVLGVTFPEALYYALATMSSSFGDLGLNDTDIRLRLFGATMMLLGAAAVGVLYAMITDYIVAARFAQHFGHRRVPHSNHVVVAGLGHVGYRVVGELLDAGYEVVAIEKDPAGPHVEELRERAAIVLGDARHADTLAKAGIERAHALVAVTNDDAANIGAALAASGANPDARAVVRVFDDVFADKVEAELGVSAACSASAVAAPTFVAAALYDDVLCAFVTEDALYAVVSTALPDALAGKTLSDAREPELVTALRDGRPVAPSEKLRPGDTVLALRSRPLKPEPATPLPPE